MTRIAVISDIHSNADALRFALELAENNKVDLTIILGDLLSYGCQPNEVIELLQDYTNNAESVFIKGNHDQIYFDLQKAGSVGKYKMADFIKESVEWTLAEIGDTSLVDKFNWQESCAVNNIYFSHANPYAYGDWRYVDTDEQCIEAAEKMKELNSMVGVFGHVHRKKAVKICDAGEIVTLPENTITGLEHVSFLNPGSIGQQRGEGYSFMLIDSSKTSFSYSFVDIEYDLSNTIDLIAKSSMSDYAKNKLISYL